MIKVCIVMYSCPSSLQLCPALRRARDNSYIQGSDSYGMLKYKAFSVESSNLIICNGTPAICHSMMGQEKHLNGKLGDVRSWNDENECYEVHFGDKSIAEPQMVPCKNIHIVFDMIYIYLRSNDRSIWGVHRGRAE